VCSSDLNPILARLGRQRRVELVEASELVHCEPGEAVFWDGEAGDTMCIVLTGRLGVYVRSGPSAERVRVKQKCAGDMVGELAFALNRQRSADVQSLGFSALLAFSPSELRRRLPAPAQGPHLADEIRTLLSDQAARFLCESLEFLPHPTRKPAPMDRPEQPWLHLEDRINVTKTFFRGEEINTEDPFFGSGGVYVVDLGEIEYTQVGGGDWTGACLDVIHVNWHGELVMPPRSYVTKSKVASIRRLDIEAVESINEGAGGEVLVALKSTLARRAPFHAAISFARSDALRAEELRTQLLDAGHTAYLLPPTIGPFLPAIRQGFTCALTHVVLVTADASERARKQGDANWVRREVDFRTSIYGERSNIIVASIGDAAHDVVVPGIAPLHFDKDAPMSVVAAGIAPELERLCSGAHLPFTRQVMPAQPLRS